MGINVEPGTGDGATLQGGNQVGFINDAAASNVNHQGMGRQGVEYRLVHQAGAVFTAGNSNDKEVAFPR
ncbi:hypothetical protein D3C80_1138620 [compost metagenome]